MVALAGLWRSFGVRPAAVIGHSQGEAAAACVAGALSLEDAAAVVAVRSRLLEALPGTGGMASVRLPADAVAERLEREAPGAVVAALNGPSSTVVSGDPAELDRLVAALKEEGVQARRLITDVAGHSAHVDGLREEMLSALSGIAPRPAEIPIVSTVTGRFVDGAELDAAHWYRNLRHMVAFDPGIRVLGERGHRVFAEVSPHPVLVSGIQEILDEDAENGPPAAGRLVTGTLRRAEGGLRRFLQSAAELHVAGVEVDWARMFRGTGVGTVELPPYPFQRRSYWLRDEAPGLADPASAGLRTADHPLLAAAVALADSGGLVLTGRLSLESQPWLADHALADQVLVPGVVLMEMVLHAGDMAGHPVLDELVLERPLALPPSGGMTIQVTVGPPRESGGREVSVHASPENGGELPDDTGGAGAWVRYAHGVLTDQAVDEPKPLEWPPPDAEPVAIDDFYDRLAAAGVAYGPVFQGLESAWRRGGEVFAEISLPPEQQGEARQGAHGSRRRR
jgi:acyl transferase domain-containing protein